MRWMKISVFAIVAMNVALFGQTDTTHYYLMSYFKNNYPGTADRTGGFFALSTDGMNWTELNSGAPTIPGSPVSEEKLMRDPFIYYDAPTMTFHLIYTSGWTQKNIGYARITVADGKDFKNFQNWDVLDAQNNRQIAMNVSDSIPGAISTWAPQIFWDDLQNKYMIYWSTDVGGAGKRAYYILTSDFKTYTNPIKFFDPGFTEIDGDLLKIADKKYYFFFKDERTSSQQIYRAIGPTPQGPFDSISSSCITNINLQGVEGPSSIKMNNEYRVYFDPYATRQNYRMIKSTDLITWTDGGTIKAAGSNFYYSHCNVIEIPKNIYEWINTTKLSVRWNPKPFTPVYYGANRFEVPGIYSLLGKRLCSPYSRSGENAVSSLPAGVFIAVDKTKRVGKYLQNTK
jgi:hypothetical protein